MASKQGIEVSQDELDSFGVYTDSGVALDPSNQGVKQLLKQASSAGRVGVAPKEAFVNASPHMDSDSMDEYASAKEESLASSPGVSARPTPVPTGVGKAAAEEAPLPTGVAGRSPVRSMLCVAVMLNHTSNRPRRPPRHHVVHSSTSSFVEISVNYIILFYS